MVSTRRSETQKNSKGLSSFSTVAEHYEQKRAQRMKESKERMEKLGIFELSKQIIKSKKPATQQKKKLPSSISNDPPRRSSRLLSLKESGAETEEKEKKKVTVAKVVKVKRPKKPKRPASAFFVFMEEFRKQYKELHPNNKSVAALGIAAGDKWKSMSDDEKGTYITMAENRKVEYDKNLLAYKQKLAENGGAAHEEESNGDDYDDEEEEEEDDDNDD